MLATVASYVIEDARSGYVFDTDHALPDIFIPFAELLALELPADALVPLAPSRGNLSPDRAQRLVVAPHIGFLVMRLMRLNRHLVLPRGT